MSTILYHNPRCSKSREALALLESKSIEFETKLYLKETPSRKEIETLVKKLNIPADKLLRKKEKVFKENCDVKVLSEKQAIDLMVEFPVLIERPILVINDKAAIGRPIENIENLLKD